MKRSLAVLLGAALVLGAPLSVFAQEPDEAVQAPSPATIAMRWQWLNPEINAFTFRDTHEVFEFRPVEPAARPWELPRAEGFTMPGDYERFAERSFTNAMLVLRDGHVVFENYRNRLAPETPHIAFSVSKTLTAMLVGQALDRGEIGSLDDLASRYVPELAGGGYHGVTIRNLLEMRSGAAIEERYDFGDNPSLAGRIHETAIIRNERRFADFATDIARRAEPGAEFNYATLDTAVLGWVLEAATGERIEDLWAERIWQPLGAEHRGHWLADGPAGTGRVLNGMGYNATLRDMGRLGQLLLDGGTANGSRILPEGWVDAMTTMKPVPGGGEQPGYGLQTWQMGSEPGAFAAVGLAGQFIYVHPASRTVIVKLSHYPPAEPEGLAAEVVAYFEAVGRTPSP
jgi:CubicO group peptidase (beta-lactamase class C family)